jgi:hypothetical protein
MIPKRVLYILIFWSRWQSFFFILLPMDESTQQITNVQDYFWCLEKNYKASWLLNYRGGSFLLPDAPEIRKE